MMIMLPDLSLEEIYKYTKKEFLIQNNIWGYKD